jgi:hypothetical protein
VVRGCGRGGLGGRSALRDGIEFCGNGDNEDQGKEAEGMKDLEICGRCRTGLKFAGYSISAIRADDAILQPSLAQIKASSTGFSDICRCS